jgi:hypothetical protein
MKKSSICKVPQTILPAFCWDIKLRLSHGEVCRKRDKENLAFYNSTFGLQIDTGTA